MIVRRFSKLDEPARYHIEVCDIIICVTGKGVEMPEILVDNACDLVELGEAIRLSGEAAKQIEAGSTRTILDLYTRNLNAVDPVRP